MRHTFLYAAFALLFCQSLLTGCGNSSKSSTYVGMLEGKSIHVPALTGGKVVKIFIETGDEVTVGAPIALIDTTELVLQHRQLSATLEELEIQEEIARTNLERARNDLNYVREREERITMLYDSQAIPQQNLDDLRNELQRANAAFAAAQQQVRSLEARKKQLGAQIGVVEKKIADALIVAPSDGLIANLYYEVGEAVPPLQPLVELIHTRELDVKIYIPEERLPHMKHGQNVTIRVDGLKKELSGTVTWVSSKAEFTPKSILTPEARTALVYAVNVTVKNPERILKHGMPVEVIL